MPKDPGVNIEELRNTWNSQPFELGIPIIDLQHLWLVHIILELEDMLSDINIESFASNVRLSFTKVMDYVSEHFSLEEDILKKFNYPHLEEHTKSHRDFFIKLGEKYRRDDIDEVKALGLAELLKKWLFQHILHEDKMYGDFLANQSVQVRQYIEEILTQNNYTITKDQLLIYRNIFKTDLHDQLPTIEAFDIVSEIKKIWMTYNLTTNITIIDIQHIWLLKIIIELDHAVKTGIAIDATFKKTIDQAMEYGKDQFSVEEKICVFLVIRTWLAI